MIDARQSAMRTSIAELAPLTDHRDVHPRTADVAFAEVDIEATNADLAHVAQRRTQRRSRRSRASPTQTGYENARRDVALKVEMGVVLDARGILLHGLLEIALQL